MNIRIQFSNGEFLLLKSIRELHYDKPGTCGNIFIHTAAGANYRIRESAVDFLETSEKDE